MGETLHLLELAGAPAITLANGPLVLVSVWKPVVFLLPLVGWAYLITTVYDKHAERFHLARRAWNAFHLFAGLVAVLAAYLMPLEGMAGFAVGLAAEVFIFGVSIAAYPMVANKDERVPPEHRVNLLDFSKYTQQRAAKKEAKLAGQAELVLKSPDGATLTVPPREAPEFATRVAAEALLLQAQAARASEVTLRHTGKEPAAYGVVYLVDGLPQAGPTMSPADAVKIIDLWKTAAKLDVADRRRKQTAMIAVSRGETRHRVRVNTSGGQQGMSLTLVIDPDAAVRRKVDALGLLPQQADELKRIVADAKGVVLIAAPPDSGGTTLLYTLVKMHDAYTQNVQTVEFDQQDAIEGARQNVFDPTKEGQEFSTLVRSILRRDPDVVGIAELPDQATAAEIAKADHDRCRQYVLLKTPGVMSALQLWLKVVNNPDAASKCLHGVVAERLLRKLCTNCRVAYQPSPDILRKLGLPADKVTQLFKKGGQVLIKNKPETCPVCAGGGYLGQEGVFETYMLGPAERELLKAGNLNALRAELRKKQLPSLQQAALKKAVDGTTSIEEVTRITAEAPTPTAKPAPGATQPTA